MKKNFTKRILFALIALLSLQAPQVQAQCLAGYSQAQINWDFLDYLQSTGSYSGWVSATRANTQYFALGPNRVTIAVNNYTLGGENATHTGDIANYTGQDVEYTPNNSGATITITFETEVMNARFTLYDIDRQAQYQINATNALSAPLVPVINFQSPTILSLGGLPVSPTITASNTAINNNQNDGTATVSVVGPVRQIVITCNNTGSDARIWLSDINACVTGSFVNNWRNISRPFNGMPSYILTLKNNTFYQLDPATGNARFIFRDNAHTNMNAMSYDPVNRYIYYGHSLTASPSATRTIYRYSINSGTVSTAIADINAAPLNIPSYESGVTSGSSSFYDGKLYLGVEASNSNRDTRRDNIVWRIDFDASQNPLRATQVYGAQADSFWAGRDRLRHDWADIGVTNNGMLYDFDGAAGDSMYYHFNMMTGQRVEFLPTGTIHGPKQLAIDWNENVYNMGGFASSTPQNVGGYIVPYNYDGTVNLANQHDVDTVIGLGAGNPLGSWGDCGEAYRPYCDFGDAPSSYDPDPWSPAVHEMDTAIRIGATWDREWIKTSSAPANADGADEDGLAYVPFLSPGVTSYLTQVSLYNNTGETGTVLAWLDYNGNGVFDASEVCQAVAPVASMPSIQTRYLYWPNATNSFSNGTYTYLRIRFVRGSSGLTAAYATGYYDNGETEDYRVTVDNFPLSVNLLDFNAKLVNENKVSLSWNSKQEDNFSGFEVERSTDNSNWTSLGFVDATGNGGTGTNAYVFDDLNPSKGKNMYRLNMKNADGKNRLSEVRTITIRKGITEMTILPNPSRGKAQLTLTAERDGQAMLLISDLTGKTVHNQAVQVRKGINSLTLPVQQLSSGTYMVKLLIGDESEVRQLIINK